MYHCPGCGGQMLFDIPSQKMKCNMCGENREISEMDNLQGFEGEEQMDGHVYTCPNCGGSLFSLDTTAATFCSFCGSSVLLREKAEKRARPERIIPFSVTKAQCIDAFRAYASKTFCLDDFMLSDDAVNNFRAIYMPYAEYKALLSGTLTADASETRGNYRYEYKCSAQVDGESKWLLRDLSLGLPDEHALRINRFDQSGVQAFSPAYLSGFYADLPDVNPAVYRESAADRIADQAVNVFRGKFPGKIVTGLEKTHKQAKNAATVTVRDNLLLPVWFMSARSKDRVSYAIVNGQNGVVSADLPVNKKKLFSFIAPIAAVLFFLIFTFLSLKPEATMVISSVIAFIVALLTRKEFKKLRDREDEVSRLQSLSNGDKDAKPLKNTSSGMSGQGKAIIGIVIAIILASFFLIGTLGDLSELVHLSASGTMLFLFVLAGILTITYLANRRCVSRGMIAILLSTLLCGIMMAVNDPEDMIYYVMSAVQVACCVFCEKDLIDAVNLQSSNPPPVFETHKGGVHDV